MQQKTDVLSSDFKEKLFQQRASKLKSPYLPSFCIRHPRGFLCPFVQLWLWLYTIMVKPLFGL